MTDELIDRKLDKKPRCQLVLGYMHGQTTTTDFGIHCPIENPLSTQVIPRTSLSPSSLSVSAPVIPCTYPLSSLPSLCHPLYTHCNPKSSPVTPCTCLCHPSLPPSSSTLSLAAQWSVVLNIHNHFSCHNSWN